MISIQASNQSESGHLLDLVLHQLLEVRERLVDVVLVRNRYTLPLATVKWSCTERTPPGLEVTRKPHGLKPMLERGPFTPGLSCQLPCSVHPLAERLLATCVHRDVALSMSGIGQLRSPSGSLWLCRPCCQSPRCQTDMTGNCGHKALVLP